MDLVHFRGDHILEVLETEFILILRVDHFIWVPWGVLGFLERLEIPLILEFQLTTQNSPWIWFISGVTHILRALETEFILILRVNRFIWVPRRVLGFLERLEIQLTLKFQLATRNSA